MLKRLKELASDSLTYGLSSMLSQFLSLFLVPFYTKELQPEDYGVLAMSAILLGFFSPLAGLGMDGALFRYYSMTEDPARKNAYFSLATQLKTAAMLLACLILIPFYSFLNSAFFQGMLTTLQFGLFLGTFLGDNFSALTIVTLRSERKVKKIALVNVATLIVTLTLSIWLVLFEKMHVTGALTAGLIGSFFRAAFYWSDSRRHFRWVAYDRNMLKDLLGYGLPVIPHKMQAQVIQTFTAFIINHQLGIATAGLYAVATKLAKPLSFVVGIVQQSWVPFKFQIHKTDNDPAHTFKQLISLYWIGIIALWGMLSLLTPWLYHWLIDPKYWAGIPYVPFIMGISVAQAGYFTATTGFELSLNQKKLVKASFVSMIVMIGLSMLTAFWFPPYCFILAQIIAYIILTVMIFPEARATIQIQFPIIKTVLYAAFSIILISISFQFVDTFLSLISFIAIVLGGIVVLHMLFPGFLHKNKFQQIKP